jgi:hypothetical protein
MARSTKIKSKLIAEDSVEFSQLTPETVPVLDSDKNIISSVVTPDELANLSGTTSPIQDQLNDESDRVTEIEDNNKVLKVYAYENNAQVFADGQPGVKDPSALIRDGWYFKNEVAGQKINWYYFDGLNQGTVTLGELNSVYAVMTFDSISAPIIAVYTLPTGTGDVIPGFAHSRIVYDGVMTPTPVVGKKYLVYGGAEPTVHPELSRINLALVPAQSIGEQLPGEQVLTISFGSSSGATVNQVQFMVESMGLFSTPVKHEMDLRIRVASQLELDTHEANTSNPHSVTKDQVGLGNVDNTSDADKPVSDATQDALDLKYDASNPSNFVDAIGAASAAPVQSVNTQTGDVVLDKTDIGLGNVDNTSDADKPISDDTQAALDLITDINWTGDYDNGVTYNVGDGVMFNGASFRMISFIGAAGYPPSSYPGSWLQVTDYLSANDIGLDQVDNTSDADKPISDATQTALDDKVSKAGDTMTGQLTILDASIVIDHSITQAIPTTTELGANYTLMLSNDGVDSSESSQTSSSFRLNRTNAASTTSDTNLVISVEDGAPFINGQVTDYANEFTRNLTLSSESLSITVNDDSIGDSTIGAIGAGSFVIQTTLADTSYTLIEGTSTGISATRFDTTTVTPLMPTLPEHYTVKEYVDNLVSGGETGLLEKFQVMKEPTGFVNRTSSTTSFSDLTREFTIQPTASSYEVYVQATKFIKSSAETITIDNASGNHYIYFNSAGTLSSTQVLNADLFQNNALISIIYWNTDTSTHSYFAEERHGLSMDGATHSYLHTVFGARYLSGLALEGFVSDGTGNFDSNAIFYSDSGSIRDEDLLISILTQSDIPVLYRQGVLWRKKAADMFPIIYSGTAGYTGTRIPFNELTGGNWQLTEIANNSFVLVHVFATNDKENPIVAIQGIATYGNVTAARLAASTEITSLSGLPFAEFVALGSVVFESSNSYTNTPKARVRSVNGGDYVDFRGTQLYTPAGEPTTHSLLSNLSSDDHLQYHTDARGDARYYTKSEVDALIGAGGSAGDIAETEVSLSNFQTSPQNITGFAFSNAVVRGFSALVTVEIDATSDLFEQFTLNGIQKNGSWNMSIESIGDNTGIVFSITSSGQIQYTSPAYAGFTSADVKFRAITTSF